MTDSALIIPAQVSGEQSQPSHSWRIAILCRAVSTGPVPAAFTHGWERTVQESSRNAASTWNPVLHSQCSGDSKSTVMLESSLLPALAFKYYTIHYTVLPNGTQNFLLQRFPVLQEM